MSLRDALDEHFGPLYDLETDVPQGELNAFYAAWNARDEEAKRLREALDAFQDGINPEDMTSRQREAMKHVTLKDKGHE